MSEVRLMLGDCLDRMCEIADGSVDLILTDLPYGRTNSRWDSLIPLVPMWAQYERILCKGGSVVLFSMQPFTSMLVMSNIKRYKVEIIWDRVNKYTNFLQAKRMPMRIHENIILFAYGKYTYNPQKRKGVPYKVVNASQRMIDSYQDHGTQTHRESDGSSAMPGTIVRFEGINRKKSDTLHVNQKPMALMEYLIRTYSNEGETVLDSCVGSGTTLIACLNTNRRGIGIEKDPEIYAIAEARVAAHRAATPLLMNQP